MQLPSHRHLQAFTQPGMENWPGPRKHVVGLDTKVTNVSHREQRENPCIPPCSSMMKKVVAMSYASAKQAQAKRRLNGQDRRRVLLELCESDKAAFELAIPRLHGRMMGRG